LDYSAQLSSRTKNLRSYLLRLAFFDEGIFFPHRLLTALKTKFLEEELE